MIPTYMSQFNAIRGFRRQFPHLSDLDTAMIRCDFINADCDAHTISLEAVADYEADRLGALNARTLEGVPPLRRSVNRKGAVARVHELFSSLPEGTTRKAAIAAAVEAGIAYCTARTQYQVWKAAN